MPAPTTDPESQTAPPDGADPLAPGWLELWLDALPPYLLGLHPPTPRCEARLRNLRRLEEAATPLCRRLGAAPREELGLRLSLLPVLQPALRESDPEVQRVWALPLAIGLRPGSAPPLLPLADGLRPLGRAELLIFRAFGEEAEDWALPGDRVAGLGRARGVDGDALHIAMTRLAAAGLLRADPDAWRATELGRALAEALAG